MGNKDKQIYLTFSVTHWEYDVCYSLRVSRLLLTHSITSAIHWEYHVCYSLTVSRLLFITQSITSATHWEYHVCYSLTVRLLLTLLFSKSILLVNSRATW